MFSIVMLFWLFVFVLCHGVSLVGELLAKRRIGELPKP